MKVLHPEDAFYLYADTPEQHMHTVATLVLDPSDAPKGFSVESLISKLEADIDVITEFHQRLTKAPLPSVPPVLVDDPNFNFRDHVRHIAVPSPGTLRQLSDIVADIASVPLERDRPLWQTWFVEGLQGGNIAIITKSHHCLIDGVTGAKFMQQQFDAERVPPKSKGRQPAWEPQHHSLFELTLKTLQTQWQTQENLGAMFIRTFRSLRNRRRVFRDNERAAELVPSMIPVAPKLKFNGAITPHRSAAMGSVSFADLKYIKNVFSVTINDVVMAACTRALRNYLIATDDLPEEPLICGVPVSISLQDKEGKNKKDQANNVGNMIVKLPVQIADPQESLIAVHDAALEAKRVFEAGFENLFLGYISALPPGIASLALQALFSKRFIQLIPTNGNVVISNFPGPPIPLYMQGAKLVATYPMGPVTNGIGLNITFMSYMDSMGFSIQACREKLPAVWDIADGLEAAIVELKSLATQKSGIKTRSATRKKPAAKKTVSRKSKNATGRALARAAGKKAKSARSPKRVRTKNV